MANYPTLSINPEYPLDEDCEDPVLRSPFEGGYELTRARFTRTREKFTIRYNTLPTADKDILKTFARVTVKGGADSFSWTHPQTSTVYTVRFEKPPKFTSEMFGFWKTEFTLVQV